MRIRLPFAGAFAFLLLLSSYAGLSSLQLTSLPLLNDKALHFLTFLILTTCFYWILDTSRRRTLHLTLITCTGVLSIGSEFLQGILPNGRIFDVYDIAANVLGSGLAVGVCYWYHGRMVERRRVRRGYAGLAGEDNALAEEDLELGEGVGAQEEGIVGLGVAGGVAAGTGVLASKTLDDEVDNWDENVEDAWDEDGEAVGEEAGVKTPSASSAGEADGEPVKKRVD